LQRRGDLACLSSIAVFASGTRWQKPELKTENASSGTCVMAIRCSLSYEYNSKEREPVIRPFVGSYSVLITQLDQSEQAKQLPVGLVPANAPAERGCRLAQRAPRLVPHIPNHLAARGF
jgi:hypothetical protein